MVLCFPTLGVRTPVPCCARQYCTSACLTLWCYVFHNLAFEPLSRIMPNNTSTSLVLKNRKVLERFKKVLMTMFLRRYCVMSKRRVPRDHVSVAVQQSPSAYKRKLSQAYMCVCVCYVLWHESPQIVMASGVVFRADSQRFVAYDAGGRV